MRDLERVWSFNDAALAHDVLDAVEDAEWRAREQARREAEGNRGHR